MIRYAFDAADMMSAPRCCRDSAMMPRVADYSSCAFAAARIAVLMPRHARVHTHAGMPCAAHAHTPLRHVRRRYERHNIFFCRCSPRLRRCRHYFAAAMMRAATILRETCAHGVALLGVERVRGAPARGEARGAQARVMTARSVRRQRRAFCCYVPVYACYRHSTLLPLRHRRRRCRLML